METATCKKRKLDWQGGTVNEFPPQKLPCQRSDDMTLEKMTVDHVTTEANKTGNGEVEITDPTLLALMQRTGYTITQENGQRKYGGPPPMWGERPPPRGAEVFVGKIPRDVFEDELVPVFETAGKIYELRLMMDFDGKNRGYAFVMFYTKAEAKGAVKKLNNYEIRKGRLLGVCYSVDNCRLFVGGIPKTKKKEDILTEMHKVTEGVVDVIVYPSASDKTKNRGFAFVEYDSHRAAAMARRKLIPGRIQLWGHPIAVDWAEPEQEVDEDIMGQVKVLYVRNLMLDTTEDKLQEIFSQFRTGCVERVKKIRDYAFVHFSSRETCMEAMEKINGTKIDDAEVEVTLAKPVDKSDYNRMAKVGAKVLGHVGDGNTAMLQPSPVINQTGMMMYPAGVYGTELAYYPLGQYNLAPSARPIRGSMRNDTMRNRVTGGSKPNNGRNGYLGYSAGKATYGRYYATNNQDRGTEMNGTTMEAPYQLGANLNEQNVSLYKTNGGVSAITAAATQIIPQYMAAAPPTPGVQQVMPAVVAQRNAEAILEEICQRHMWGTPTYQLLTTTGPDNRQLFLYRISIPVLASLFPHHPYFQPSTLCVSVDEAKSHAAENVLAQLALQADGSPAIVPMTTMIAQPPAGYQNMFAQTPIQVRTSPVTPSVPHQYVPVSTPSPTIPMSFVDPSTMMQPITVMYQ